MKEPTEPMQTQAPKHRAWLRLADAEHEDFLAGNRQGLEELRSALDEALRTGESMTPIDEFRGVLCLDDADFERAPNSDASPWSVYVFFTVVLTAVALCFVGLFTVGRWIWLALL